MDSQVSWSSVCFAIPRLRLVRVVYGSSYSGSMRCPLQMSAKIMSVEASLRLVPQAISLILVRVVLRDIAGRPWISTAQEMALPTAVAAMRVLVCRLCGRRWMSLRILSALVIRLVTLI